MRTMPFSFMMITFALIFISNAKDRKKTTQPPEPVAHWTGTLSMDEKTTWNEGCISMSGERHVNVTFTNALPTLFRDDDATDFSAYTDNKGTGSAEFHSQGNMCGQNGKTDCSVSGVSKLHNVTVREWDSTYDIEVIAPPCIGTNSDGSTYGPDVMSITVSNEHLLDRNRLAGAKTTTGQVTGTTATYTRTVTWSLVRSVGAVELIIIPEDYFEWMPEPGKDENTKGSVMNVDLKLQNFGGGSPSLKAVSFELHLQNTSTEPGISINDPFASANPLPDIRFLPQTNATPSNNFQDLVIRCNKCNAATVAVAAYDGGGWTTLVAEATLENNTKVKGMLDLSGGPHEVPIPRRSPGSHIASLWLEENNNPQETDDIESSNGNTNYGDGLSSYEEYRGVIAEGGFKRLDPMKKEVGIKMKKNEIPEFAGGISKFEGAADIRVIRFWETEIAADRKLNKNFKTANVYKQSALFLQKGTLSGPLGNSFGGQAIPTQVSKTVIDQNKIRSSYQDRLAEARSIHAVLSYSEKDLFETVTAHELSHSVNVPHHGSLAPNSLNLQIQAGRPVRIFDFRGNEITGRPYSITGRGGDRGNEQSGDVDCFMVNNSLCDWAVTSTPDSMFFYQVPLIPLGVKLCTSKTGTGLNSEKDANGHYIYFGDAVNGNCLSLVKLK